MNSPRSRSEELGGKKASTELRKHIMSIEKKRKLDKLFDLLTPRL